MLSPETDIDFKRGRGRPSLNLLDMIRNDLKPLILDFIDLRVIALHFDRVKWKSLKQFSF